MKGVLVLIGLLVFVGLGCFGDSEGEKISPSTRRIAECTTEPGISRINLVTQMMENDLLTNAPRYIEQQDRKYIDSVAWRMLTYSRKVTLIDSIAFSVRCVEPQVLTLKLLDMYSGKELASWGTGYGIRIKN